MEQNRNCGNNGFEMYNIGDRCEYVQYAIEIERTLHNMQKELNICIDPRKSSHAHHACGNRVLRCRLVRHS